MRWHNGSLQRVKGHVVETGQKRCKGQRWRDEGMWVIFLLSNTIPVHAGSLLSVHPCNHRPWPSPPWLVLPHSFFFLCQRTLHNLKILFSLHLPFHIHMGVVPFSICHSLYFSTEGIVTLIILSALSSPIPPPSLVCPSTICLWPTASLLTVYWVKAILFSFLFNTRLSPLLHPFITLSICVCVSVLNCKTDIITGKEFFRQQWAPSWMFSTPAAHRHPTYNSAFKDTRAQKHTLVDNVPKEQDKSQNTKNISLKAE